MKRQAGAGRRRPPNAPPKADPQGAARDLVQELDNPSRFETDPPLLEIVERAAREWQITFDAVESPLLVLETDGRIRRLNRTARELSARPFAELIGRPVGDVAAGEPWAGAAELVREVLATGGPRGRTVPEAAGDRTWELSASLAAGSGGEVGRIIVVARDVTGQVRLQESLRRSEMMSALGSLVAGVAHEVRNPLFGISSALDAFEARFGGQPEFKNYLWVLQSQVRRLTDLMRDLLEYGRPPRLTLAPESLGEVVAEAVGRSAELARQHEVAIVADLDADLPRLELDRPRMVQVVENLLNNAIYLTPEGGRIEVTGTPAGTGADRRVVCRVLDTGPGFAPEDLERVFEPFYGRRAGGSGLGLSIVQRIVEQHGGRVTVGNRPSGGAFVELELPLAPAADRERPTRPGASP